MIGLLIAILLAALAYWLIVLLTGSTILGIVAAIVVIIAGLGTAYDRGGRL